MYIAKITFKKPQGSDVDYEKIESLIHSYLIGLERNGNILKLSLPLKATEEVISFQAIIPEADSLKKKYRPFCSGYKGLREKSVNVTHKVLNKSPTYVFYPEKGEVEKHPENVEFLILSAHFSDETSPIKTSNVSYIPIYKITTPEDRYFHEKIYFWKDKYKSIYALWIHGHKEIEKFTLKQLADPKSELSAEGMEICRKVEEILNKKVFYSLRVPYYKRDSQNKEIDLCPSCKSYWKLEEDLLRYFGYKCDKCLLLGILTHAF